MGYGEGGDCELLKWQQDARAEEDAAMKFFHHHHFLSFRDFLSEEEEQKRHLFHEAGHVWYGERYGGRLEHLSLTPGGESVATLQGGFTLAQQYEIGVAGLLVEAKAMASWLGGNAPLHPDKMSPLAQRIFNEVSAHSDDHHFGFLVVVPLDARIPSKETAGVSVSDFTKPIEEGLSQDSILAALLAVTGVLNSPREWAQLRERAAGLG